MRNKITKLSASLFLIMTTVMMLSAQVTAPLADGGYLIRIKESTGLVDNSGYAGGATDNPNVGGWYPQASVFQRWILSEVESGYYKIQSARYEDAFVTVDGNSNDDDANIIQAGWADSDYQKWEIQDQENGTFKVISKGSGKAWYSLNTNNPDHAIARNIVQVGSFDTDLQEFEFIATADSVISGPYESGKSYIIASECTQMVMTEDPISDVSGNLVQRTFEGESNQKWQLDWIEDVTEGETTRSYYKITNRDSRLVLTLADTATVGDGISVVTQPWSDDPDMQMFQMWAIEPVVGIGDENQVNVFSRMNGGRTIEIQGGPQWVEGQNLATWWKFENTAEWERWQRWRFIMIDAFPLKTRESIVDQTTVHIYPNPAEEVCRIICKSENGIGSVELYDITGKMVIQKDFNFVTGENEIGLNLEGVQKGIYLVRVNTPGGSALTSKMLVK